MTAPYALSIDVGTTFTAAATWRNGRASTVTLGEHTDAIPSVLYLRDDGVFLVGHAAERRAITDPSRVARDFKRRMGDDVDMVLGSDTFMIETLSGHIIRWVIDRVSEREGADPSYVTLTCPASWGEYRRSQLTRAAAIAGLDAVGLMTEPGAAATYYASLNRMEPGVTLAVYDFGGGTFDAAVLRKTGDGFEVCGPPLGDDEIGGVDLDAAVLRLIAQDAELALPTFDVSDPTTATALAQLRAHAVDAKETLSFDQVAEVPVILPGVNRTVRLTRERFEDSIRETLLRTIDILGETLDRAGVNPGTLSAVLLVGGSSRIPLVAELIGTELDVPTLLDAHPKHAVCLGGAIAAAGRLGPAPPVDLVGAATNGPARARPGRADTGAVTGADIDVDLATARLTRPMDSPQVPGAADVARHRVTARDEPLIARLDAPSDTDRARLRARLMVLVTAVVAVIVVGLLLARLR